MELGRPWRTAAVLAAIFGVSLATYAVETPNFTSVIDDGPLDVKPLSGEELSPAVEKFYATGENPYNGDASALAEGKTLYAANCQACHLPDGSGQIGPSLIGDTHHYPRFTTDKGLFEIIYGGAAGAMQPFGKRLKQDEILKIMAHVRTLKKKS